MPARADITCFGAGPAALPTDVLETAPQALLNYNATGLGIAEHSHRFELANKFSKRRKVRAPNITIYSTFRARLPNYLRTPS